MPPRRNIPVPLAENTVPLHVLLPVEALNTRLSNLGRHLLALRTSSLFIESSHSMSLQRLNELTLEFVRCSIILFLFLFIFVV